MQRLMYESAWDKTISDKDRLLVEKTFREAILTEKDIQFSTLRIDKNYKNELLVLVIVHNNTDEDFSFVERSICYTENDTIQAKNIFTFQNLIIPARTSMPWTFIFPVGSYQANASLDKGRLEICP